MKSGQRRNSVWLAAALLWLLFIWGNSLQTAEESSRLSLGVLEWLMPLLAQTGLPEETWHTLIRKLAHMAEFAVAGILWSVVLPPRREHTPPVRWTRRGVVLAICLAAAVIDETIQRFVPGRSGEVRDVCIDLLGAALGILAAAAAAALWNDRKLRRNV